MHLRFAANISLLFTERPFIERFAAARQADFAAIEIQYPYGLNANDLAHRARDFGIEIVLINAPAGNREHGDRGLACLPGRQAEFRESIHRALDYAHTIACPRVHVLCGVVPKDCTEDAAFACAVHNFAWAADQARGAGVEILIEAINGNDVPGYLLRSVAHGVRLIDKAKAETLATDTLHLLFDVYHCRVAERDVITPLVTHFPLISHVQIADVPGRGEPETGEIDWSAIFTTLGQLDYRGWIGCEYRPRETTLASLRWRKKWKHWTADF